MLHQAAKIDDENERHEVIEWMYNLEHQVFGLPTPDALVYLNVPSVKRVELLKQQHEEDGRPLDVAEINTDHQEKVDQYAADVMTVYAGSQTLDCMSGDTLRSINEINDEIYQIVRGILEVN